MTAVNVTVLLVAGSHGNDSRSRRRSRDPCSDSRSGGGVAAVAIVSSSGQSGAAGGSGGGRGA